MALADTCRNFKRNVRRKLKGIKGKGTYTCTPSGDSASSEIEGDYQLGK
jgi:hypothetical protein